LLLNVVTFPYIILLYDVDSLKSAKFSTELKLVFSSQCS